ncbi:MAG: helix-turn-helix domain-containing protein [Eubacteriales bacterium]|nr:helix-turn-helix domain-containing protein [Eubacteriales bacterium]
MNNYLGEKIKDLRNKQILTQTQLADKLNVSRQTVSNWEKGTCQPDCDSVLKLCKVLGADPNCLYGHGQNQDEEACDIAQTIEPEETACDVPPDAEPEETIGDIVQNIAQDETDQEQVKPTETEECKPVKKKKIGRIIVTSIAIALLIFVGGVAAIPFFEPIGSTAQYFVSFYLSTADKMKTVAIACLVAVIWLAVKLVGMIKKLKNNKENKHD